MNRKFLVGTVVLLAISILFLWKHFHPKQKAATYTIAILQTASHPALDAARDGFVEELQARLGSNVDFIIKNAQGEVAQAHAIAQQLHANSKIDAFLAIATPAAQALGTVEQRRPLLISAVTDPQALGLDQHSNITGTKDMVNVVAEIDILTSLLPNAKTVGIIYTVGEVNSSVLAKQMHTAIEQKGLIWKDFTFNNESDIQVVVESACRKVDVLLAPTDNVIASAITVVAKTAHRYIKPLIVSDNMLVASGALAAQGVDYKKSGRATAEIAYQILVDGKKPTDFPIQSAKNDEIYVNTQVLKELGLFLPEQLKSRTNLV